jgi:hypothetical protein
MLKRKFANITSDYVSASSTRNFLLDDTFNDLATEVNNNSSGSRRSGTVSTRYNLRPRRNSQRHSRTTFIMQQGIEFENQILKRIKVQFGTEVVTQICHTPTDIRSGQKYLETLKALLAHKPIIYQGTIRNTSLHTFGAPDLIIQNKYLRQLINHCGDNSAAPDDYSIVDIKYSRLKLRSLGDALLVSGNQRAYAGQAYLYKTCLDEAIKELNQNDASTRSAQQIASQTHAYILGRGNCFTSRGQKYVSNNCFDRCGRVLETPELISKVGRAIAWRHDLREHHDEYLAEIEELMNNAATVQGLSRSELYPNMTVNVTPQKRRVAERLDELTKIWQVGPKRRQVAHSAGIYNFSDPRCTAETLGFGSGSTIGPIVDRMLEFHRDTSSVKYKLYPGNYAAMLGHEAYIDFFLDFESITALADDFSQLPVSNYEKYVYMAGIGHATSASFVQTTFTIDQMTRDAEYKLFYQLLTHISSIAGTKKYRIYHWGVAEAIYLSDLYRRYSSRLPLDLLKIWATILESLVDICKLLRGNLLIRNIYRFGLKEVGRGLTMHNLTQVVWRDPNDDGIKTMIDAIQWYTSTDPNAISPLPQIERYNQDDVMALYKILTWFRTIHQLELCSDK